ncbi:hypothetical protein CLOM_g17366 [Closterium sp. NIES-68]|nr:hypothetical protein CLOM_g17366 [Closterium sp. NIES-68]GJP66668.1 hypothetical protein CLOP_g23578 [Closterium sp. NIES-67]
MIVSSLHLLRQLGFRCPVRLREACCLLLLLCHVCSACAYILVFGPLVLIFSLLNCRRQGYSLASAAYGWWMHGLAFFVEKVAGTEFVLSLDHASHPFQGADNHNNNHNHNHKHDRPLEPTLSRSSTVTDLESLPRRAFVMCNHLSECDWLFICCLAARVQGALGGLRFVLKRSIGHVPLVGWALQMMHFVFIDRCWRTDEGAMGATLQQLRACVGHEERHGEHEEGHKEWRMERHEEQQQKQSQKQGSGFWLAIFPEGTDFTDRKRDACQEFARSRGLPVLNHVLLPRTRGTYLCLHSLHAVFEAVIDVTVAYDKGKGTLPDLVKMAIGRGPRRVLLHLKTLPVDAPRALRQHSFNEAMFDIYSRKDTLLSQVYATGRMPASTSTACSLHPPTVVGFASLALSGLITITITTYMCTLVLLQKEHDWW